MYDTCIIICRQNIGTINQFAEKICRYMSGLRFCIGTLYKHVYIYSRKRENKTECIYLRACVYVFEIVAISHSATVEDERYLFSEIFIDFIVSECY